MYFIKNNNSMTMKYTGVLKYTLSKCSDIQRKHFVLTNRTRKLQAVNLSITIKYL